MPKLTPSGKRTAVGDVENKLSKQYGLGDPRVYATLNKIGLMRGIEDDGEGQEGGTGEVR